MALTKRELDACIGLAAATLTTHATPLVLRYNLLNLWELSYLKTPNCIASNPRFTAITLSVDQLTLNDLMRLKEHAGAPLASFLATLRPAALLLWLRCPSFSVA